MYVCMYVCVRVCVCVWCLCLCLSVSVSVSVSVCGAGTTIQQQSTRLTLVCSSLPCVLLVNQHQALHPALDAVLGALRTSLDPAKPADMRLAQLALVKVLLGAVDGQSGDDGEESKVTDVAMRAALDDGLRANARAVIADLLLPNMVWRVGRVAATIRYVLWLCVAAL